MAEFWLFLIFSGGGRTKAAPTVVRVVDTVCGLLKRPLAFGLGALFFYVNLRFLAASDFFFLRMLGLS